MASTGERVAQQYHALILLLLFGSSRKVERKLDEIEGVKVYAQEGVLYVETPQLEDVLVINMAGAIVKNEKQIGLVSYEGIYIVCVGEKSYVERRKLSVQRDEQGRFSAFAS